MIGPLACYGDGWRQLWPNFLMLLVTGIVAVLVSAPASIMGDLADDAKGFSAVYYGASAFAAWVLLTGPISYGFDFVCLKAARDEEIEVRDVFEGFRRYVHVVLANLGVGFIVVIGLIFLIVPGIIFACRLALTPYLVLDQGMSAMDAMQESWDMTRGYGWTVFFIGCLTIPVVLLGIVALIIGVAISAMWIAMTFATLYAKLDALDEEVYAPSA